MNVMQRVGDLRIARGGGGGEDGAPDRCIGPGHMTGQFADVANKKGGWFGHGRSPTIDRSSESL